MCVCVCARVCVRACVCVRTCASIFFNCRSCTNSVPFLEGQLTGLISALINPVSVGAQYFLLSALLPPVSETPPFLFEDTEFGLYSAGGSSLAVGPKNI